MFLDHAAVTLIYNHGLDEVSPLLENIGLAMRLIGRMAFPLYAFLLVQGFMWTRDWKKYAARVAVFALVSEIPFDLAVAGEMWYSRAQNTIFVLLIGLICMKMLEALEQQFGLGIGMSERFLKSETGNERRSERERSISQGRHRGNDTLVESRNDIGGKVLGSALAIWVTATAMFVAEFLRGDYGALGVLLIAVLYVFRHRPAEQLGFGCMTLLMIYNFSLYTLFAWIAFFFINRYNGERGRKLGLMPYVFYPAHLLVVWLAGVVITGA